MIHTQQLSGAGLRGSKQNSMRRSIHGIGRNADA